MKRVVILLVLFAGCATEKPVKVEIICPPKDVDYEEMKRICDEYNKSESVVVKEHFSKKFIPRHAGR